MTIGVEITTNKTTITMMIATWSRRKVLRIMTEKEIKA